MLGDKKNITAEDVGKIIGSAQTKIGSKDSSNKNLTIFDIFLADVSEDNSKTTVCIETAAQFDKLAEVLFQDIDKNKDNFKQLPKGSLYPLYREIYFHLHAMKRIYETIGKTACEEAFHRVLVEINDSVKDAYKRALKDVNPDGINLAEINKKLSQSGKGIIKNAHKSFQSQLSSKLTADKLKTIKKEAKNITATSNDIIYVDDTSVMWAAGNNVASHHRELNKEADQDNKISKQKTQYFVRDKNGSNTDRKPPRITFRMPSFAVKHSLFTKVGKDKYIDDTEGKLVKFITDEAINNLIPVDSNNNKTKPQKPKAIIYNLYTALNDSFFDEIKNQQTQSAEYILKGVHQYNKSQLEDKKDIKNQEPCKLKSDGVFCFVQNISVNGFGAPLGYDSGDDLVTEATLMTELSLLHTLYDVLDEKAKAQADSVFESYSGFLVKNGGKGYFCQEFNYKKALDNINLIKTPCLNQVYSGSEFNTQAKYALAKLFACDQHFTNNGCLIQSLSGFVEDVSMQGCKTAIDRTAMVNNRIAILERAMNETGSRDFEAIREKLKVLANATNKSAVDTAAKELDKALTEAVNKYGVYKAASFQTMCDIGGVFKCLPKISSFFGAWDPRNWNRNRAENNKMTNIAPSSGKMQIHKALYKFCLGAWKPTWVEWLKGFFVKGGESDSGVGEVKTNNFANSTYRIMLSLKDTESVKKFYNKPLESLDKDEGFEDFKKFLSGLCEGKRREEVEQKIREIVGPPLDGNEEKVKAFIDKCVGKGPNVPS